MSKQGSGSRIDRAVLLLVVMVAAWLRLGWARVVPFGYDEARASRMALEMVRQGKLAVVGIPSSAGVPNFPGMIWLYALPYAFSSDPLAAVWFTGLANVLAVAGVWWLARQAWGRWPAGLAAALFATSPYLVFYSRGIWGQDWLAPGAVLWAVCVLKGVQRKSDWWIAGAAFLAGFLGQIHLAGAALALMMLWVLVRFRLWKRWRGLLVGGALAALAAAPMGLHLLRSGVGRGFVDVLRQTATFSWTSLRQWWRLGISSGWEWFWLGPQWRWNEPLAPVLHWVPRILAAAIVSGALTLAALAMRRTGRKATHGWTAGTALREILVPWALAAPVLFLWSRTPPYIQYQLAAMPALCLTAGAAARSGRRPVVRAVLRAALLSVAVVQTAAIGVTLNTVGREYVPGGLGTPLLYSQNAARQLQRQGLPVVVETAGADPAFDGDAAVFDVLLWGSDRRLVDARVALLLPEKGGNLLFTFDTLPAWEVATELGIGVAGSLPRREREPPYVTLRVAPPYELKLTPVGPVRLTNGAELIGWTMRALADGGKRLITAWRVSQQGTADYHQFNHLYLDGDAQPAAVHDIDAQSTAWEAGDLLITWVDFEAVKGRVSRWEVGMYTYPNIVRVPLAAAGGGDSIPLPVEP